MHIPLAHTGLKKTVLSFRHRRTPWVGKQCALVNRKQVGRWALFHAECFSAETLLIEPKTWGNFLPPVTPRNAKEGQQQAAQFVTLCFHQK